MKKAFLLLMLLCIAPAVIYAQQVSINDTITLEGKITRSTLEEFSWFKKNHQAYQPEKFVIQKIKKRAGGIKIVIILGTWCSDSREHVPAFYTVCDQAGIDEIELIAVNRKKISPGLDLSGFAIEYVPLIIVYVNGKEKGRIVESPKKNLETDLLKLLR